MKRLQSAYKNRLDRMFFLWIQCVVLLWTRYLIVFRCKSAYVVNSKRYQIYNLHFLLVVQLSYTIWQCNGWNSTAHQVYKEKKANNFVLVIMFIHGLILESWYSK